MIYFFLTVPSQEQAQYGLIEKRIRSDLTQLHLYKISCTNTPFWYTTNLMERRRQTTGMAINADGNDAGNTSYELHNQCMRNSQCGKWSMHRLCTLEKVAKD